MWDQPYRRKPVYRRTWFLTILGLFIAAGTVLVVASVAGLSGKAAREID